MKTRSIFVLMGVVIVLGVLGFWYFGRSAGQPTASPTPSPTATAMSNTYDQAVSDGAVKVPYLSTDFTLATKLAQITVNSYIPPCDPTFSYCLFYNGSAYAGTNFESAGVRIQNRSDLTTQMQCLNQLPTSYTDLVPVTASGSDYATSVFSPLGDAGAGHYATGAEYRLWYNNSCYEFETRIGQTQFANYPAGTIKEFTGADQSALQNELQEMLDNITIGNNEAVSFPPAQTTPATQ